VSTGCKDCHADVPRTEIGRDSLPASSSPETSLFARKRTPFTLSERVLAQYDVPAVSVTSALRLPRSHVCVR
jgi:hypothetical protein